MAGSVIIGNNTGVAFNSRGFDLVVELTRNVLKASAPDLIDTVYESMDVEYMSFISLDTLDGTDLERFHVATKKALLDWKQDNSEPFPEWDELIDKLEADERLKQI
jgi:hypothetical protein